MTNLTINVIDRNHTIEITQSFSKKASRFGSEEYKMLQEAKRDNPTYRVVIKKAASGDHMKGLTHEYMKEYIENHPLTLTVELENEEGENEEVELPILTVFYNLLGKDENGNDLEFAETASYGELKKWFLEQYPSIRPANNVKKMLSAKKKTEKKSA